MRNKPVAAWLALYAGANVNIRMYKDHGIHAIEISTALCNGGERKCMVELMPIEQRSNFKSCAPLRHQGSAHQPTNEYADHDAEQHNKAAQLVRQTSLQDGLGHCW
jgi:hypothetical protein